MWLEPSFTRGRETELEWLRDLYEQHRKLETELPEFEEFKRDSCFFYSNNTDYVAFQNNIQQGVPFGTPSGKIELFSKRLFDLKNPKEIPGTPSYTPVSYTHLSNWRIGVWERSLLFASAKKKAPAKQTWAQLSF